MKVSGLKYLAKQGVENIWKNRMMSFASFCVLLVSLLLVGVATLFYICLLYTSPSPRDLSTSRMPSSA